MVDKVFGPAGADRLDMLVGSTAPAPAAEGEWQVYEPAEPVEALGEAVYLDLGDLLLDAAGEVVLLAGGDLPVSVLSHEPVTATGVVTEHVTAGGLDVTGLHYYCFESGITLYSPSDLSIVTDPLAT